MAARRTDPVFILGISAFYHDAAACLLRNGEIVAAAQEERFTRKKFDPDFPRHAIRFCLQEGGIGPDDLHHVVFYEKPWIHFERLLETYLDYAPRGLRSFLQAMSVWLGEKLFMRRVIRRALGWKRPVLFTEHHEAHMASAFYPSPFEEAAVLTVDGVGEWATASWGTGQGNSLRLGGELHFPHSLGLLYSSFTGYLGFKVNSGEYKVMGLAPYGRPRYRETILDELVDLREDGSFRLRMEYFQYPHGLRMTNQRFHRLFGGPPREPESEVEQRHMDIARSLQAVTEEILLRMARHVHRETGMRHLVLAGGVALNCVANGRILREGPFEDIWVQPAAGDAGGALGCAWTAWHRYLGEPREAEGRDRMQGAYLGPAHDDEQIRTSLEAFGAPCHTLEDSVVAGTIAELIDAGKVVGVFQGRMEFGPRALGNRSILGDARSVEMQSTLNLKIKYRESFRPFAPAILHERLGDFFQIDRPTPYMLLVAPVHPDHRRSLSVAEQARTGLDRLGLPRSDIPAVTHVDDSARIQSVDGVTNRRFHDVLRAFEERTGVGCVINTSFNVRGEPIVCTPEDAYRCFMNTEMDHLVIGNLLLNKEEQPGRETLPPRERKDAAPVEPCRGREFGLVMAAALLAIALWGCWREGFELGALRIAILVTGFALAFLGLAAPGLLSLPYRGWMGIARLLSRLISPVLLSLFYFLIITPTGLLRRAFGADPLDRRSAESGSCWRKKEDDGRGLERYTQQF